MKVPGTNGRLGALGTYPSSERHHPRRSERARGGLGSRHRTTDGRPLGFLVRGGTAEVEGGSMSLTPHRIRPLPAVDD